MADSIGNMSHSGLLPHPLHHLRGLRGILAVAVLVATAFVMTWIARSSGDMEAFLAFLLASVALLACAVILVRATAVAAFEQVALGADAVALFAVAMLAPALIVDNWRNADMTAAILLVIAGSAVWIGRISSGKAQLRLSALTIGSLVALAVVVAVWILRETSSLSNQDGASAPVALAAIAPLFSAGAASRQPIGIALGVAASTLVLIGVETMSDHSHLLASAGILVVGGFVATRPPTVDIESQLDDVALRRQPWLPAAVLVALAGLIAALNGSWQWLAVASFAVVAASTIAAQGVDLVTHERLLVRLTRLNQLTARQARLDPLTRLPNRAALDTRLAEEVERAIRYRHPASVLFVDLDHFKSINDLQGHEAGDRALRAVGNTIRSTIRTPDFVARFGGEEFVIIAPGTWAADAAVLGHRIQVAVGDAVHHVDDRPVTVSVGIAGVPEHAATAEDVLRIADEALYRAKHGGRNRVEIAAVLEDQDLLDNS